MRDPGLLAVLQKIKVTALAKALGMTQPAVSQWERVPAERVLAVEAATGVSRTIIRPDLYPPAARRARRGLAEHVA